MGKKCIYCGAELDDEALFCDECGKKQDENEKRELEESMKHEQAAQEAAEREAKEKVEAECNAKEEQTVERKNHSAIFAIIGLILGIVSIILLCSGSIVSVLTAIIGVIISIKGLKTKKKGVAIVGIILNVLFLGFCVWAIISGTSEEETSEKVTVQSENVAVQTTDNATELTEKIEDLDTEKGDSSESTEIIESQSDDTSNIVSQEIDDDESIIPATSFEDLSMIDTMPCMFQINDAQYSIAGLTMEQVKTLFPNVEKYDENAVMDQEAGIAFLSNNNKNVDAIYIGSEEDYLYKGIHVGMTKKDVNAKLGEPAQDDNDGWSCWYYDAAGERVEKEEDAVYIVNVEYDDDNIAELLILGYYQQSVTNAILVSIENQNALLDLSDSDIEVYLDGEYMVSIAEGDVRILMLPYDEKNHKITVKKSGKEKQSVTFSVKDCEDLDGTVYGIGFNVNYSLIAVERVQQKDFYYAYADFFYLYVLVIDGKPVDLSEVEMSKWLQEMYNFAR